MPPSFSQLTWLVAAAGPSGTSIRDIMRTTGADIKSWTENHHPKIKRPCRMFVVEVKGCWIAGTAGYLAIT